MDNSQSLNLCQLTTTVSLDSVQNKNPATEVIINENNETHASFQITYESSFTHSKNSNFENNKISNLQNIGTDRMDREECEMFVSLESADYNPNCKTQNTEQKTSTTFCTQKKLTAHSYDNNEEVKKDTEKLVSQDKIRKIYNTIDTNTSTVDEKEINFHSLKNTIDKQSNSNKTDSLYNCQKDLNPNSVHTYTSEESLMKQTENNPFRNDSKQNTNECYLSLTNEESGKRQEITLCQSSQFTSNILIMSKKQQTPDDETDSINNLQLKKNLEHNQLSFLTDLEPLINTRNEENNKMISYKTQDITHEMTNTTISPEIHLQSTDKTQICEIFKEKSNSNNSEDIQLSVEETENNYKQENQSSNSMKIINASHETLNSSKDEGMDGKCASYEGNESHKLNNDKSLGNNESINSISITEETKEMSSELIITENKQDDNVKNKNGLNEMDKDPSLPILENIDEQPKNSNVLFSNSLLEIKETSSLLHITNKQKKTNKEEPSEQMMDHELTTAPYLDNPPPQNISMELRDKSDSNEKCAFSGDEPDTSNCKFLVHENTQNIYCNTQEFTMNVFSDNDKYLQKSTNYENDFLDVLKISEVKYFSQPTLPTFYLESETDEDSNESETYCSKDTSELTESADNVAEMSFLQDFVQGENDSKQNLGIPPTSYKDCNENSNAKILQSHSGLINNNSITDANQIFCEHQNLTTDKEVREDMLLTVSPNTFRKRSCGNSQYDGEMKSDSGIYENDYKKELYCKHIEDVPLFRETQEVTRDHLENLQKEKLTMCQICNKEITKIFNEVEELNIDIKVINDFNVSELSLRDISPATVSEILENNSIQEVPNLLPADNECTSKEDENVSNNLENSINNINTDSKNANNFEIECLGLSTSDHKPINENASKTKTDILKRVNTSNLSVKEYDPALNEYFIFCNSDPLPLQCSDDDDSHDIQHTSSYPADSECHKNKHITYIQYDDNDLNLFQFNENELNNIMDPLLVNGKLYESQDHPSDATYNSDNIIDDIIELEIENALKKSDNISQVESKGIKNATTQTDITGSFNICKHSTCSDYQSTEKHYTYTKYQGLIQKRNIEALCLEPVIMIKKARCDYLMEHSSQLLISNSCTDADVEEEKLKSHYHTSKTLADKLDIDNNVKDSHIFKENAFSDTDQKVPEENDDSWKNDDMNQNELYNSNQPIIGNLFQWDNSSSVKMSLQGTTKCTKHPLRLGLSRRAKPIPLHPTAIFKK